MPKVTKNKEQEMEQITPCAYAGDPDDEYCCSCNGVTMVENGETFPCTACQSYTPKVVKPDAAPTQTHEQPRDEAKPAQVDTYTPQGITTCIKAESGVSIETKKGWYRLSYTEERIIPESADIEAERQALWNTVNAEVDRQVEEIKSII